MSANTKTIFQVILFLLIAAGLIIWQFSNISSSQLNEMLEAIRQANATYLILFFIIGCLSHLVRALRWNQLLTASGQRSRLGNTFGAVMVGYLANTLVPRLGEIMRCSTLFKYEKIPVDTSLGTVISERLWDTICLLLVFIIVVLAEYDIVNQYYLSLMDNIIQSLSGKTYLLIGLILFGMLAIALVFFIIKKFKGGKFTNIIQRVLTGLQSIIKVENKFLFIIYTVLLWILYGAVIWMGFKSMTATTELGFITALTVTAFGSFAMILTPGGIGAYPPVVAAILILYGIDSNMGLAVGWLSWVMQTLVIIILGLLSVILLPILNNKSSTIQ